MSKNCIRFSSTPLSGVFLGVAETMLVSYCIVVWILFHVNLLY